METILDKTYLQELKDICDKDNGLLIPEHVVEYARDPNTALHSKFIWDDSEAAQMWRIHQARNLIRIAVTIIPGINEPVKAYVSLTTDRRDGGAYRPMVSILSQEELRKQMLEDAKRELYWFREKYRVLKELTVVFDAIDKI